MDYFSTNSVPHPNTIQSGRSKYYPKRTIHILSKADAAYLPWQTFLFAIIKPIAIEHQLDHLCNEYLFLLGPGTNKTNPAPSCRLLLKKYKSIPDNKYWIRGREAMQYCGRKGETFSIWLRGHLFKMRTSF